METSDEDVGGGSARVGVELDGAADQRLEFRHERPISPELEATLLTRLLGLTSLRMLLRKDDRRDLGASGTTSEGESGGRSVLGPATALGVAECVGRSGESWYLELL